MKKLVLSVLFVMLLAPRAGALAVEAGDTYAVGTDPTRLLAGDLNRDGVTDLVTLDSVGNTATTLLGDDAGGFVAEGAVAIGRSRTSLVLGDLNRDGNPDLVTDGTSSGYVYVRYGDGTGGFPTAKNFELSSYPLLAVATADVNGDAREDVIIDAKNGVRVFLQTRKGDFVAAAGSSCNGRTSEIAVGDLNGDASPDVVALSAATGMVCVFRGNPNGSLTLASERTIGGRPSSVALGDLDRDGDTDAVVAKPDAAGVAVLLGDGAGNLNAGTDAPASPGVTSVVLADMNADGRRDVVAASPSSNDLTVLLGDGTGRLSAASGSPFTVDGEPSGVVTLDAGGDGADDVVLARSAADDVLVVRNTSTRSFEATPDAVDFGDQAEGTTSDVRRVAASGEGLATRIDHVDVDSPEFAVTSDRCTGATLGDGYASCDVEVAFSPAAVGARTATLTLRSADKSQTVALTGSGTDDRPPETRITAGPDATTIDDTADFSFASDEDGSTFECAMDESAFAPCVSPWTSEPLVSGTHTFGVRATDPSSNFDPTPATWTFTVTLPAEEPPADGDAPQTTIVEHPDELTSDTTPTFRFVSDEANATFTCGVDNATATACTSPFTSAELGEGEHVFTVAAVDAAGNADTTPDTFRFRVDVTEPDTTISGPSRATRYRMRFIFRFSEDVERIFCSVDGSGYSECRTPYSGRAFRPGVHVLRVKAVDGAGNAESTPAIKRFRILRGR